MSVNMIIVTCFLFEIIHIQLTGERRIVVVLEVARQHFLSKLSGIFHD